MHSSYNAPLYAYNAPNYDRSSKPLNNAPLSQWSQESSDSLDIKKPFAVDYISSYSLPYKAHNSHNQALVSNILDRISRGKGVRSYLLSENYTEREMLHAIRTLTTLFNNNLNTLHNQMASVLPSGAIATPNTHNFISKIEEHTEKGTRWTSHLRGENFPEKQILRSLTNFIQMAQAHFESLHDSMSQLQQRADQLSGHGHTYTQPPPENNALISEALNQRRKGTGSRSRLHTMFVPYGENYTELKGVKMMTMTGEFLITNMSYYHQWMDRLQKQLGVKRQTRRNEPLNRQYYDNLHQISNDAQFNSMNMMDSNRVDRRLLAMMQPLAFIVADNSEYMQKRLSSSIIPQMMQLMKR